MVKTPRTRHSKPNRPAVTIDLEANPEALQKDSAPGSGQIEADPAEAGLHSKPDALTEDSPIEQPVEDRIEVEAASTGTSAGKDYAYEEPSEPKVAPVQSEGPPPSGNTLSMLTAGLLGGAVALLGAGLLQFAGVLGAPGGGAGDNDALNTEIAQLKSEVAALRQVDPNAAVAGVTATIDQLKADIAALQSTVQSGAGGDAAAVAGLQEKLAQVEAAVTSLTEQGAGAAAADVAALGVKLTAVEQAVAALTGKVDAQASQPKIALAIAAAALKSAVERGAPFTAELETFAAIAPGAPQLEPLRKHSATGVMTRADIAKAFPEVANAMVAATEPAVQDAGFFQRLLSSAESVVKVRPIGEVSGEEPGARVARMEVAINSGDYAKALAEYDALPEAAKAASTSLVESIKARSEVEALVDQMIAGAMKAA